MATMSKVILTGSDDGRGIEVAATGTAGTLIHTAVAGTSDIDEIWLYAVNSSTGAIKLTLEWGDVTVSDDLIEVTIPAESGLVLVAPGLLLQDTRVVRAFAGTTNTINIHGYVNRITA